MIRVALRQFRAEGAAGIALLATFAIVLAVTGPNLAHAYHAFESSCKAAGNCATAPNPVLNVDRPVPGVLARGGGQGGAGANQPLPIPGMPRARAIR